MNDACARIEERLPAYTDGELAGGALAEVERHLAGCAGCRRALARLRQADALLAAWEAPRPSARADALFAARRAEIERGAVRPARLTWQSAMRPARLVWAGGLAAALLLAVLLPGRLHGPARKRVAAGPLTTVSRQADAVPPTGGRRVAAAGEPDRRARRATERHARRPARPATGWHPRVRAVPHPAAPVAEEPVPPYLLLAEAPDPYGAAEAPAAPDREELLTACVVSCATPECAVAAMTSEAME